MAKIINVVAGVLIKNNQVLLTSRPQGKVYAGFWEFPGGKIEANESQEQALVRELKEELGINVSTSGIKYLTTIENLYEHGHVYLNVFTVDKFHGNIIAKEQQQLHWHNIKDQCNLANLLPTTNKILATIKVSI